MTTLHKDPNIKITPGTLGQAAVASTPGTDGYYTTIQVATTQVSLDQTSTGTETYEPTLAEQYNLRLATYDEIVQHLWWGATSDLCDIVAFIMETINNTQYMYDPLT